MTTKSKPLSSVYPYSGSNSFGLSADTSFQVKYTDTFVGVENPRFREAISNHVNATTIASGVKHEIKSSSDAGGYITWQVPNNPTLRWSKFSGFPSSAAAPRFGVFTDPGSRADNLALGKFYSNAQSAIASFNGSVFVGEVAEAAALLTNPAKALRASLVSLAAAYKRVIRNRQKMSARELDQLMKQLSRLYLEYAFGWRPLINDTRDAIEAYARIVGKVHTTQCRGFGNETVPRSEASGVDTYVDGEFRGRSLQLGSDEKQVIYYGAVKAYTEGGDHRAAKDVLGFNPGNFVPSVWELIPFSFVVDYFTNVGNIIGAATFVNSELAWVSKTTRQIAILKRSSVWDKSLSNPSSGKLGWGGSGGYSWETRKIAFAREPVTHVGVPSLEFSIPGRPTTWINLAALTVQFTNLASSISQLRK